MKQQNYSSMIQRAYALHIPYSINRKEIRMDRIVINGGKPLSGEIEISGMKNAAVAILLANILIEDNFVAKK